MRYAWAIVTSPAEEPVAVDDVKKQARVTHSREDDLFYAYIQTARDAAEQYMGRAILPQTWRMDLGEWADEVVLPMAAPLSSVTSVKYYATDGTLTTLSSSAYVVDTTSQPGCLRRAPGESWPSLQCDRHLTVQITYVAGWASEADVPETIKQGIRLLAAASYVYREGDPGMRDAWTAAEACWRRAGVFTVVDPQCV